MNVNVIGHLAVFNVFILLARPLVASPLREASLDGVKDYYDRVVHFYLPTNMPFSNRYEQPLKLTEFGVETSSYNYYKSVLKVYAQFVFIVEKDTKNLLLLFNRDLEGFIETNDVQQVPSLTMDEARLRAECYLQGLGIVLPSCMALKALEFNLNRKSCWEVRWELTANGIPFDSFISFDAQEVVVVFHEKYGFVGFGGCCDFPAPKSMEMRITREVAIAKAEKVVPLIQRSPYYLQCRFPGFKVTGLRSAEFRIVAPNWLLNPRRVVWLREEPPEETRLCWVIRFTSVDTLDRKEEPLVPPSFVVYVDAGTGEIVGANFT